VRVALYWPVVLPFLTGVVVLAASRRPGLRYGASLGGAVLHFGCVFAIAMETAASGIVAEQAGGWPAPFGITLVADRLSAAMAAIAGFVGLCVVVYSHADISERLQGAGYHAFLHILIGSICGAFLAGDLFNLYVWFEVMLMASFALLVLGQTRAQLDGGVKYVTINLVATLLFLSGIGLVYGMTGTLNLADLHLKAREAARPELMMAVSAFFLTAFGIKAAVFPFFFWLPASYHTPPAAVSAVFSGLLTKVGVYALIRLYTLVFPSDWIVAHPLLLVLAVLTMVTGVLGAAAQGEVRRILSFHIISQVGYMVMGLALFSPLALAGTVFYLLHHIVVKANLFLVGGIMRRAGGGFDLSALGGLYRHRPGIALLFFVPAFSLAGFPPLSGFWAKLVLVRASLDAGHYAVAAAAVAVGFLTLYSMTKIWGEAFWKPAPAGADGRDPAPDGAVSPWLLVPSAAMGCVTVVLGVAAGPFMDFSMQAAADLLSPEVYVRAVLGRVP
jgi:multicomponent Na+:H+ antiporter subunit D